MTSSDVKSAFAAAGIKVRVRDLRIKFRVCTVSGQPHDKKAAASVAASLGCTDVLGHSGAMFLQAHELIAYKPGAIVRLAA